ncbi:hypothetical protein GCM10028805_09700 [Spirosoma harenae]
MKYYTAYGLSIGSEISLPPLIEKMSGPIDVLIRRGKLPISKTKRLSKIYRAGFQAHFAQNGFQELWLHWEPLMSFMAINGSELVIDTALIDENLVSLFTLSEAIGLILFQRGYFLLHGSAIQINNRGAVFLGEPGAGKSTTAAAFAQKDVSVVSDDLVCISIDESGQPFLIPAFSQIKVWQTVVDGLQLAKNELVPVREGTTKYSWHKPGIFTESAVPLERIFILNQSRKSEWPMMQLPKHQVPIALLRHFPLPDSLLEGKVLKDYFDNSVALAHSVALFNMNRPADFANLQAFADELKTEMSHED